MASSDHNLSEVTQTHWISSKGEITGFKAPQKVNRVPVGKIKLDQLADEVLEMIDNDYPDNDFKETIFSRLKDAYKSDSTFSTSFQKLAYSVLGKYGMIIVDPEDNELKKLSSSFWQNIISNLSDLIHSLQSRSQLIRDYDYEVQVLAEKGRPAIFVMENDIRRKVVLEGHSIRARSDIVQSIDELKILAAESPERLSAGVTFRPLLQGFLFPTGAYVAGPHEMAYWSQISELFDIVNISKPALVPRASFTLIEKKIRKRLDKYKLEEGEIFQNFNDLTNRLLTEKADKQTDELFSRFRDAIEENGLKLTELGNTAQYKGLDSHINLGLKKMIYQLDKLHNRFNNRLKLSNSDILEDLEKISTHLLPAGKPQERVINPFYYFVRYGDIIVKNILSHSEEAIGSHVFLDMEELIK